MITPICEIILFLQTHLNLCCYCAHDQLQKVLLAKEPGSDVQLSKGCRQKKALLRHTVGVRVFSNDRCSAEVHRSPSWPRASVLLGVVELEVTRAIWEPVEFPCSPASKPRWFFMIRTLPGSTSPALGLYRTTEAEEIWCDQALVCPFLPSSSFSGWHSAATPFSILELSNLSRGWSFRCL